MRGPFKTVSAHGAIPLLIGAAVTASGYSQMIVRSVAIVLCAVWLALDIGVWIFSLEWSTGKKNMVFCISACILCCLAMGVMYWFLASTLEDQRTDTMSRLTAQIYPDPEETKSVFSITNEGREVIGHHQLSCEIHTVLGSNGAAVEDLSSDVHEVASTMGPGESQSDACLSEFVFTPYRLVCADIVVDFSYELDNQPGIRQTKKLRFFGYGSPFRWIPEPENAKVDYCGHP